MNSIPFRITKANTAKDGVRHWYATASDTAMDDEGEQTSLELFNDFIERIDKNIAVPFLPPPATPFLGVAHYDNMSGAGVAGVATKMYVDGNRLKLSGEFLDNPLADALYNAIITDLVAVKKGEAVELPIRISAGWYDLGHTHGDFVFEPKSANDSCPICAAGQTVGKSYTRGQLDHLAATRVPVNKRTVLELETKSMGQITRKDDAASIVGDELATKLDKKSQMVGKSAAMVTKAEDAKPDDTNTPPPDNAKTENKKVAGVDGVTCPSCESLLDDVHVGDECPECGYKFTQADLASKEDKKPSPAQAPTPPVNEKSFGGATSIDKARGHVTRKVGKSAAAQPVTNWDLLNGVLTNILDGRGSLRSRVAKAKIVLDQFGGELAAIKGAVDNAYLMATVDVPATQDTPVYNMDEPMPDETESEAGNDYDDSARYLVDEVTLALSDDYLTKDERLSKIQAALDIFAEVVKRKVDERMGETVDDVVAIEKSMTAAITPLLDQIQALSERVESLSSPTAVKQPPTPKRKSIAVPQAVLKSGGTKPGSIRDIARRSVGV